MNLNTGDSKNIGRLAGDFGFFLDRDVLLEPAVPRPQESAEDFGGEAFDCVHDAGMASASERADDLRQVTLAASGALGQKATEERGCDGEHGGDDAAADPDLLSDHGCDVG